jgi:hypothetical protein
MELTLVIGGKKFGIEAEIRKEFTALTLDKYEFPHVRTGDFHLIFLLLALVPESRVARLNQEKLDLVGFLRTRKLALDTFGMKALDSCFQEAFLSVILQPSAKATAAALCFPVRNFTTRKEEKHVDLEIHRCMKKTRPVKLLDLNKAQ